MLLSSIAITLTPFFKPLKALVIELKLISDALQIRMNFVKVLPSATADSQLSEEHLLLTLDRGGNHLLNFQSSRSELGEAAAIEGQDKRHGRQIEGDEESHANLEAIDLSGLQGEVGDGIWDGDGRGKVSGRRCACHYQSGETVVLDPAPHASPRGGGARVLPRLEPGD